MASDLEDAMMLRWTQENSYVVNIEPKIVLGKRENENVFSSAALRMRLGYIFKPVAKKVSTA